MATSSKKGTKVGDTVGGRKVTGTRKGVATSFEGDKKDNSDGPSRGSNPQVNAINEARFANVEKGRDAYRGEAAAKGQIPEPVVPEPIVETPLQANPAIPAQVANNIPAPSVPGSPTAPVDTGATTPNRFQAAHAQLSAGGATPTGNPGQNMAAVFGATPAAPPESTVVDQVFSEDPMINSIMQSATEFLSAESQKTTLMQDYKKLYKESGLKDINEELIDAETILDGTEDDIRNEIQTAGGFGTESQVQAMTLSRNKGLLKRYNQLFAAKQDAQQNLNTMMTINQQDRQMAQDRVNKQIDVAFKLADFRTQATNATKESYRWMVSTLGVDGTYEAYKGDPKQMGNLEKILGLPMGGLAAGAADARSKRASEDYLKQLQIMKAERELGIGVPTDTTALSKTQDTIGTIDSLLGDVQATGPNWISRQNPLNMFTGKQQNFIANVEQLRQGLTLEKLAASKGQGVTFGALSEGEMKLVSDSATKLGTWAIKNKEGNVVGYNVQDKDLKNELGKINNYAKLDAIKQGADPSSIGVQEIDGKFFVQNWDGSVTQLK